MTQAMNLANFSNSLDSSGGVPPTQLNSVVPISKGGTNASTAAAARTSLDVAQTTGANATGTWPISITGSAPAVITANFTIEQDGANLVIKYGATTIVTITSAGAISASSSVSGS